MEDNIYTPSESSVNDNLVNETTEALPLATRGSRLGASMLDGVILLVPMMIFMYLLGWFNDPAKMGNLSLLESFLASVFGLVLYLLVNFSLLKNHGQTVGKRVFKIKIVGLDGEKPDMVTLIVKRYLPQVVVALIPIAGDFVALIDSLFIFGKQQRCVHDLIAKTKVVKCS